MPQWIKDIGGWLKTWAGGGWLGLAGRTGTDVQNLVRGILEFIMRVYIQSAWGLGNLSYYTAKVLATHRHWVVWLAYERIPRALQIAESYAYYQARSVRLDARAARGRIRAEFSHWIKWVNDSLRLLIALEVYRLSQWIRWVHSTLLRALAVAVSTINARIDWVYQDLSRKIEYVDTSLSNWIAYVRDKAAKDLALAVHNLTDYVNYVCDTLRKEFNAALAKLNKDTAKAYTSTRQAQGGTISKLLDFVAGRNPEIKDIVSALAKLILDLLEVDDPLVRIAATFALKEIVDHLGIDTVIGKFVNDIISEFINSGGISDIPGVATDVGNRLNNTESEWAQFWANGGKQLEEFGDGLQEEDSDLFMLFMLGFVAGGIVDPSGTATVVYDVIGKPMQAVIRGFEDLLTL